jgi:hypothetical protein
MFSGVLDTAAKAPAIRNGSSARETAVFKGTPSNPHSMTWHAGDGSPIPASTISSDGKRLLLLCSACQLAATLGVLRQFGAIPTTAERLNQGHCGYHASAKNIYGSDFIGESGALSCGHLKIAGDATLVTCCGELEILLRGSDCRVLNLSFVLEDA